MLRRLCPTTKLKLTYSRMSSSIIPTTSSNSLAKNENKSHWKSVVDPKTGGTYWHNIKTNETTHIGAPQPDTWVPVKDKQTGLIYYHNPVTDETTAVGQSKPPMYRELVVSQPTQNLAHYSQRHPNPFTNPPQESFGRSMVTYATLGASMTLGIVFMRVVLGI